MKINIIRLINLLFLFASFSSCGLQNSSDTFELQIGDLLFQDLNGSSLSDAIEEVTSENKPMSFSHVGIIVPNEEGTLVVLEATGEAVQLTAVSSFLKRSLNANKKPQVCVARLKKNHQDRIKEAVSYGKSLLGFSYDSVYLMADSSYYCSELIYEMFKHSLDGSDIFKLNPMTFKDAKTGEFHPVWVDHYQNLGVEIPEGKLGCNPNGMSESKEIDWVFDYSK